MIDFPATPTTGQIFTAAGSSWRYDGTKWVAYGAGQGNAGRNLIHNSMFNIAQRGAGPFTVHGAYTLDRWMPFIIGGDADSFTKATLSDTDRAQIGDEAATSGLQNVFTGSAAATAFSRMVQRIEDARRLAGKIITISFYAKCASGALKLGVSLYQYMGTGGTPSSDVNGTGQSVTLSTSFARYSVTLTLGSLSGFTLGTNGDHFTQVFIWYSSGANSNATAGNIGVQSGTIQLWGVQLEIGSTATPLEKPDPRYDLANCQRFYQVGNFSDYGASVSGATRTAMVFLQVTMRAAPTVAVGFTANPGITGPTMTALNTQCLVVSGTQNTTSYGLAGNFTATADL